MKKATTLSRTLLSALCSLTLLSTTAPVFAEDNQALVSDKEKRRHETTGVLGGAVIGGLVGGPIGAVLTAGFGAWVSDLTIAKKENSLMAASLDEQREAFLALQAEYRALEARYLVTSRDVQAARIRHASFEAQAREQTVCCGDSELSLHFKTGSADIEPLYDSKLNEFAALVKKMPEAVIEITGHADRRGEDASNLALSQRRLQAVEKRLRNLGVRSRGIQTSAFGESRPVSATDNFENNFFDRRVVVKVVSPDNGMLTRADD